MIDDYLVEMASVAARLSSYGLTGAEEWGTPELREAALPCLRVPESPSVVRIFFLPGANVWQPGDQEIIITVAGKSYVARRDTANALLGLEYGPVDYGATLEGSHIEVLAEEVRVQ